MVYPDMKQVHVLAKKYGITDTIRKSDKKNKKLKVMFNGKWIHFGHTDYDDFTTHKDKNRQKNYCSRAGSIVNKNGKLTGNDPSSPNFYAMRLLWDCTPKRIRR